MKGTVKGLRNTLLTIGCLVLIVAASSKIEIECPPTVEHGWFTP